MPDKALVLADVCRALTAGNSVAATEALRSQYGFLAVPVSERKYGPAESTPVFVRDGFVDRYSGARLVFPGALRLLSHLLPVEFPYHPNWRTDQTHPAYWELTATIDHLVPVSRGGADSESNWLTTSMLRNSAKANWTIEELGWKLHPAGSLRDWDGLLEWFLKTYETLDRKRLPAGLSQWYRAGKTARNH